MKKKLMIGSILVVIAAGIATFSYWILHNQCD